MDGGGSGGGGACLLSGCKDTGIYSHGNCFVNLSSTHVFQYMHATDEERCDIGKPLCVIWILEPNLSDNLTLLNGFSGCMYVLP